MSERWTSRRVLGWMSEDFSARGIASARLEAELYRHDSRVAESRERAVRRLQRRADKEEVET